MSSLLVSGQLPDLAKETPVWLAAGEASSKAAVTAASGVRGAECPVADLEQYLDFFALARASSTHAGSELRK